MIFLTHLKTQPRERVWESSPASTFVYAEGTEDPFRFLAFLFGYSEHSTRALTWWRGPLAAVGIGPLARRWRRLWPGARHRASNAKEFTLGGSLLYPMHEHNNRDTCSSFSPYVQKSNRCTLLRGSGCKSFDIPILTLNAH
jgi:hypothetical protein